MVGGMWYTSLGMSMVTENNGDKINFKKMRSIFFFGLILLLLLSFLYVIRPFFYPIFWAAVLAVMFYPAYTGLRNVTDMPSMSAILSVILAIVTILAPLALIITLIIHQSFALYQSVASGDWLLFRVRGVAEWIQQTPLAPYLENVTKDWAEYAANVTKFLTVFLFNNLRNITQNSVQFIFFLFITLYTLFFFLRDGDKLLKRLQYLSPLSDQHERSLYERFTSTARAALKSTIIVGSIQGTLGGILFWLTGVEGALIWGVVMFLFSLIPGIGTSLVWLPVGIIMLIVGNIWQGATILLVGALIISTIDNLLRPPLVGKDIQMHPLIVLFSTLGGIFLFGISGFVIGPIIASLLLALISIYDHYYLRELKHNE